MSPVYLVHSLVVYRVENTSLPYTLQENELSKPETCDFSTLYTTRERAKSTGDSHVSGLLSSFSCSV
jgi:hypothetical protein